MAKPSGKPPAKIIPAATASRLFANWRAARRWFLSGDKCVASYDPNNGRLHWIIDGPTEQYVASLVYSKRADLLFMTGGFPDHHLLAIKPDGLGNVTQTKIVWRTNKGVAYVPSPILEGDYLLIVSDSGVAHCFDAATGKRV